MSSTLTIVMYQSGAIGGITQTGVLGSVVLLRQDQGSTTKSQDAVTRATALAKRQLDVLCGQKLI